MEAQARISIRRALALIQVLGQASLSACGEQAEPAACVGGDERLQRYGTDCICCHDEFGVAGTIDRDSPEVASIVVTGADGQAKMAPNSFGNFFRHLQLTPPLRPVVTGVDGRSLSMSGPAPHGSCNRCHDGAAVPRVHAP